MAWPEGSEAGDRIRSIDPAAVAEGRSVRHRIPVILDCDPGHDDIAAILLADRFTDLRAVTTVSGNAPVEQTTRNALIALSIFGINVPVHRGAGQPFTVEAHHFPQIHGESGLAGPELPIPRRAPDPTSAVERMLLEARTTEGLWIVATGPLTNVALALRADETFGRRIAGISIMGGGIAFGNVTAAAEYNIWADPESADAVFRSGLPLLVSPLDVTHQVLVGRQFLQRLDRMGTDVSEFMSAIFSHFAKAYADVFSDEELGPLHDPCAVLALTHPELFDFRQLHIEVLRSGPGRGMTLADRRGVKGTQAPNATVAVGVRSDAVLDLVAETIQGRGR